MIFLVQTIQEPFRQRDNIVPPLPQRRNVDGNDVQPVIEILPELLVLHHIQQIPVGGGKDADVVITERLLTHGSQRAESDMVIELNGENSRGRVISRSVAKNDSVQVFRPCVVGNAKCFGHVQCDSIIMDEAKIRSVPEIAANDLDAQLIHEAAIGRIAGDQLLKLETLGLTEEEAEDRILKGFLA